MWFCEVEIIHIEFEADLSDGVTASCYTIVKSPLKYCSALTLMFYKICVFFNVLLNAITKKNVAAACKLANPTVMPRCIRHDFLNSA